MTVAQPLSIRIDEVVTNDLKMEARRLSFEKNEDISYVDLIRTAVEQYVATISPGIKKIEVKTYLNKDEDEDVSLESDDLDSFLREFNINMNSPRALRYTAQAVEIIHKESIGRKVLRVDYTKGKTPRYERDVASIAHVVSRRGAVPDQICEGNEVMLPTYEIACHPSINFSEILRGRLEMFNRAALLAGEAIAREENHNLINLLKAGVTSAQTVKGELYSMDQLETAFGMICRHGKLPAHMICSSNTLLYLQRITNGIKGDWAFQIADVQSQQGGHYKSAKIIITEQISDDNIIFTGPKDQVGVFAVSHDPIALVSNESVRLRVGYVLFECIGMGVFSDYFVSMVERKQEEKPVYPTQIAAGSAHVVPKKKTTKPERRKATPE